MGLLSANLLPWDGWPLGWQGYQLDKDLGKETSGDRKVRSENSLRSTGDRISNTGKAAHGVLLKIWG